jgi:hypothetical protein
MAAKLTRLTPKIAIQLRLVAESCTICSSQSRRPVRKLLDTPWYVVKKTARNTIHKCHAVSWNERLMFNSFSVFTSFISEPD